MEKVEKKKDGVLETTQDAITLGKTLLRTARYAAIAVLEPQTGAPLASRVGTATDIDGTPLILISMLAAHTPALLADPRCSLLLGDPGKGDPLAHPRLSLACRAAKLERDTPEHARAQRRYLNRNPKAQLYVGLGDFSFFRLEIQGASLNGGFGRAYNLTRNDLISEGPALEALAESEQSALDHMNADHRDAIAVYAHHFAKAEGNDWTLTGLDLEGMDLASGDTIRRIFFPRKLTDAGEFRKILIEMARIGKTAE
ncbi:putative heme iron utilization protein [Mesorhizobium soli]|uniref:HugZ family pyridoxamine 5'-phosphate oxidase n=1 Tax=Pseudaminobacter soli (ex Li et al. 2025) TaxID=1295366 RepID=UPI0024757CDA|nr:HugZ family protein [Mesorhizobium soli]MDH6234908.1 putative heme iron utilization protein [Mesorhizobium soli]